MNDDFEGGEFIFTEMDAKTVTVSKPLPEKLFGIFTSILPPSQHLAGCWISNTSEFKNSRNKEDPSDLWIIKMLSISDCSSPF